MQNKNYIGNQTKKFILNFKYHISVRMFFEYGISKANNKNSFPTSASER